MSDEALNGQQKIVGVFNRAASTYDRVGPRVFSRFGQRLVDLAQLSPGSRVLDVAAGRGAVLFPAAKKVSPGGHVVGVDLSEEMVGQTAAEIRSGGWQHVEMHQMDAEQLRFPDGSFDRVLCGFSLWFFPRPDTALREFSRVLKPEGRVGLTTWTADCPALSLARQVLRPHLPAGSSGHLRQGALEFDSPTQLREALRSTPFGGIDVRVEEADFVYGDVDEWWASLWAHGVRGQLEKLTPSAHEQAKGDATSQLQAFACEDGIHIVFRVLFAFGTKPS